MLRLRCHCGRNLAETDDPLGIDVSPRPGVARPRKHEHGSVEVFTWACPDCGDTPTLSSRRIAAAYAEHKHDAVRGVVLLTIGRDL